MARFPKDCSVCNTSCASKKKWIDHLLQPEHSDKSKEQCHSWGAEIKQCSLVVRGKYPLARKAILEYFSGEKRFVVDFVCDVSRPLFGVFRFENELAVDQLLELTGSEIDVDGDGDRIELRKAMEMSESEWKAVLPEPIAAANADLSKDTTAEVEDKKSKKNRKKKGISQATEEEMKAPKTGLTRDNGNKVAGKTNDPELEEMQMQVKMVEQGSVPNLMDQYAVLRSEVEIPLQQIQRIFDLMDRIRDAIHEHDPGAWVTYFRHQYLKLLNPTSNPVLIYVSQANSKPLDLNIEEILETISIKPLGTEHQQTVEAGRRYNDEKGGLSFELVTAGHYYVEVETGQWANYLLKFDPRAKSLLTLIHFWARENQVTLAEEKIAQQKKFDAIPDPAALEWLCIFFLCKNKIIPTPVEVLNRTTSEPKLEVRGGWHLHLPFPPRKSDFIDVWKAEHKKDAPKGGSKAYVLDVLRLTREFFQFYTSGDFRGAVLKTNDAEVISTKSAFVSGLMKKPPSKSEETMAQAQKNQESMLEELEKKLFLMQPFVPGGRFSICQEKFERVVQPLMRLAARKLDFYLENVYQQQYKGDGILEVELASHFRSGELRIVEGPSKLKVHLGLDLEQDEEELEENRHQELTYLQCDCKSTGSTCNQDSFRCHFTSVLEKMLKSEIEERKIKMVEKRLEELFGSLEFWNSEAILFRSCHWNLNRVAAESRVYFFLDYSGLYGERNEKQVMFRVGSKERQEVISRIESKGESFKKFRDLLLAPLDDPVGAIGEKEQLLTFCEPNVGLEFCVASRFYFPEMQTDALVKYLSTFDRRVKPVMILILYWAKKNGIQLGKGGSAKIGLAPEPALLEWLVLHFLHTKQILPTPRYIFDLDPDEKVYFDGVNVDFTLNDEHAKEWRSRYEKESKRKIVLEVYTLATQFFEYWSKLGKTAKHRPLVIDLMNFRHFYKDRMDKVEDKNDLQALGKKTKVPSFYLKLINSEPVIREGFYSRSEAVTFLHPLHVRYGFSFCSETFVEFVCPKMAVTAVNLSKKLVTERRKGGKKAKKVNQVSDIESLFEV